MVIGLGNDISTCRVLTYMATLEQLAAGGQLIRHEPDFEQWEMPSRFILYPPEFPGWYEGDFKNAPRVRGRNLSPYEQAEQILYEFMLGRPMAYDVDYKKLGPLGQHVWELKTPDVRIFGWFARRRYFVAVRGELKDKIPNAKLYGPYIESVVNFRTALDLDLPKAVTEIAKDAIL